MTRCPVTPTLVMTSLKIFHQFLHHVTAPPTVANTMDLIPSLVFPTYHGDSHSTELIFPHCLVGKRPSKKSRILKLEMLIA